MDRLTKYCDHHERREAAPVTMKLFRGPNDELFFETTKDLCPKCLKRLEHFIDRGLSAPKKGSTDNAAKENS